MTAPGHEGANDAGAWTVVGTRPPAAVVGMPKEAEAGRRRPHPAAQDIPSAILGRISRRLRRRGSALGQNLCLQGTRGVFIRRIKGGPGAPAELQGIPSSMDIPRIAPYKGIDAAGGEAFPRRTRLVFPYCLAVGGRLPAGWRAWPAAIRERIQLRKRGVPPMEH